EYKMIHKRKKWLKIHLTICYSLGISLFPALDNGRYGHLKGNKPLILKLDYRAEGAVTKDMNDVIYFFKIQI
ncbi:hypothetical protein ACJX0J_017383, partial [Zea mays]